MRVTAFPSGTSCPLLLPAGKEGKCVGVAEPPPPPPAPAVTFCMLCVCQLPMCLGRSGLLGSSDPGVASHWVPQKRNNTCLFYLLRLSRRLPAMYSLLSIQWRKFLWKTCRSSGETCSMKTPMPYQSYPTMVSTKLDCKSCPWGAYRVRGQGGGVLERQRAAAWYSATRHCS